MLEQLLELQKQIIEYDKLFREEIAKVKLSLDKMTETLNQINNK
ncbi:hypothetical protein [Desulforamulus reducens]|nr:hypothetical protein [Desulforamulus reducens]